MTVDVADETVRAAFDAALAEHGTRGLARVAKVSPAYVSRVSRGHERIAGKLAAHLGFERVTVYRRLR